MEHIISSVAPGSIAQEMGIEPGDRLLEVNGKSPEDVFDYRYLMNEEEILVLIRKANGEEWELEIEKEYEDDLGIEFENGLMDDYRSCRNKCIFCFIDQLPKGMRSTLYFKDDDSRLSFLQGNYLTLTNMSEHDIDRIIQYKLSPINISFQTMNPAQSMPGWYQTLMPCWRSTAMCARATSTASQRRTAIRLCSSATSVWSVCCCRT